MNSPEKRIAIFDDDEEILSICRFILEDKGWKVYTFVDCNEITGRVSKIQPQVILMDNWIPDEGGVQATQKLKKDESLKKIPVIYFSANSDIEILANHAGAENYLAKPFDIDDLERLIDTAMKG